MVFLHFGVVRGTGEIDRSAVGDGVLGVCVLNAVLVVGEFGSGDGHAVGCSVHCDKGEDAGLELRVLVKVFAQMGRGPLGGGWLC